MKGQLIETLSLRVLPGTFAAVRFDPKDAVPDWASGSFTAVTRTEDELSIICDEEIVPPSVSARRGFRALVVNGPLEFDAVGILVSIAAPLASAAIPILAISTYDTDYVFLPATRLPDARRALEDAGYNVTEG